MATSSPGIELPFLIWMQGYADGIIKSLQENRHELQVPRSTDENFRTASLSFSLRESPAPVTAEPFSHDVARIATESLGMALLCRRLSFLLEAYEVAYTLGPDGVNSETFLWKDGRFQAEDRFLARIFRRGEDFGLEREADAYSFEVVYVSIGSPLRFGLRIRRTAKAAATAAAIVTAPIGGAATVPVPATVPAVVATTSQLPLIISSVGLTVSATGVGVTVLHNRWQAQKDELNKNTSDEINEIQYEIRHGHGNALQIALKDTGFYDGDTDGIIGHQTRSAAREFMASRGLSAETMLTDPNFLRPLVRDAIEARNRRS